MNNSEKQHLSDCCRAGVRVVGGDEGTNHWECEKCGKSCNDLFYATPTPQQNDWKDGWMNLPHDPHCGNAVNDAYAIPFIRAELSQVEAEAYERGAEEEATRQNNQVLFRIKDAIARERERHSEDEIELLVALADMYGQYCAEEGHLHMHAGEQASTLLERYRVIATDQRGRGEINWDLLHALQEKAGEDKPQ